MSSRAFQHISVAIIEAELESIFIRGEVTQGGQGADLTRKSPLESDEILKVGFEIKFVGVDTGSRNGKLGPRPIPQTKLELLLPIPSLIGFEAMRQARRGRYLRQRDLLADAMHQAVGFNPQHIASRHTNIGRELNGQKQFYVLSLKSIIGIGILSVEAPPTEDVAAFEFGVEAEPTTELGIDIDHGKGSPTVNILGHHLKEEAKKKETYGADSLQ